MIPNGCGPQAKILTGEGKYESTISSGRQHPRILPQVLAGPTKDRLAQDLDAACLSFLRANCSIPPHPPGMVCCIFWGCTGLLLLFKSICLAFSANHLLASNIALTGEDMYVYLHLHPGQNAIHCSCQTPPSCNSARDTAIDCASLHCHYSWS